MERIGLIGGVSWVSTMEYYRRFNLLAQGVAGDHSSADLAIISLNFQTILELQRKGDSNGEFQILVEAARHLEHSGAAKVLICSNTTSNTCDRIARSVGIPVVNIIDATVSRVVESGIRRIGLLGTRYVMERAFYKERFHKADVEVLVPGKPARDSVHSAIYDDLCRYEFSLGARKAIFDAMDDLVAQDVQAIVLGCTEIPLITDGEPNYRSIPLIDSIDVHISAAIRGFQQTTMMIG